MKKVLNIIDYYITKERNVCHYPLSDCKFYTSIRFEDNSPEFMFRPYLSYYSKKELINKLMRLRKYVKQTDKNIDIAIKRKFIYYNPKRLRLKGRLFDKKGNPYSTFLLFVLTNCIVYLNEEDRQIIEKDWGITLLQRRGQVAQFLSKYFLCLELNLSPKFLLVHKFIEKGNGK